MMTTAVLLPPGSSADSVFYLQPSPAVSRPSAGTIVRRWMSYSISISMTYMITTQQYLAELYCFFALACVSPTLLSSKLEISHFFDFGIVIYIRSGIGDCSLALTVIMASFQLLENFYLCQKIWVIYVSSTIQRLTQSHYLRRSAILHT